MRARSGPSTPIGRVESLHTSAQPKRVMQHLAVPPTGARLGELLETMLQCIAVDSAEERNQQHQSAGPTGEDTDRIRVVGGDRAQASREVLNRCEAMENAHTSVNDNVVVGHTSLANLNSPPTREAESSLRIDDDGADVWSFGTAEVDPRRALACHGHAISSRVGPRPDEFSSACLWAVRLVGRENGARSRTKQIPVSDEDTLFSQTEA